MGEIKRQKGQGAAADFGGRVRGDWVADTLCVGNRVADTQSLKGGGVTRSNCSESDA